MINGPIPPATATLALAVGLFFALICYLLTNLSPGGMITPGWLALTLIGAPTQILVMAGVTGATYVGAHVLQRHLILYGKRLFAAVMMLSVVLSVGYFLAIQGEQSTLFDPRATIGFIIPGLIGYQLIRQPPIPTLLSTGIASFASYGVIASGLLLGLFSVA